MTERLRVLLLEDNVSDARLTAHELTRAGIEADCVRVDTADAYAAQLRSGLDLIIADYSLPQFDAPRALALLHEAGLDIPFIVVTGTVTEDDVVECMKRGASDYLLKDRLGRLGHAVVRALEAKRDRDERRHALDALYESERKFRSLVEAAPSVVVYLTAALEVIEFNPEAERLCGVSREEALGAPFLDLFPPGVGRSALRRGLDAVLMGRETGPFETTLGRYDAERIVLWTATRQLTAEGESAGLIVMGQDVTERVRLEEQFRQSQKMEAVGRLAGGVAHDFNNLLTVISGYGAFALARLGETEPARDDITEIVAAGGRAAALTRQLLAFSRKQVLQPTVFNLNSTVAEMGRMLERLIGEDIELEVRADPELGSMRSDRGQIEQVLANLVVNARDAMPEGGKLTIETRNELLDESYVEAHPYVKTGPYVMVSVSDTGCGMDEDTRAKIFEPFFTTKEFGKGTGLGLATVYGIVKQSGGSVEVYSEPGRGSVFKVYLPRVDGAATESGATPGRPVTRGGRETILLVEDQAKVRALAVTILTSYGYRVLDAGTGAEALAICETRNEPLDLLVTDVVLPGMNGREIAEGVGKAYPGIKTLFMSGYTEDATVLNRVLNEGGAFLPKPFTPDGLAARVREVLDAS